MYTRPSYSQPNRKFVAANSTAMRCRNGAHCMTGLDWNEIAPRRAPDVILFLYRPSPHRNDDGTTPEKIPTRMENLSQQMKSFRGRHDSCHLSRTSATPES